MIKLRDNFHMVTDVAELPRLNPTELFMDVETQRNFEHKKHGGLYPWKGDKICGISLTCDDSKDVFYLPVRHRTGVNLPVKNVMDYCRDLMSICRDWINHFVPFDAMMFAVGDGVEFDCRLIDTVVLSKIHYSDLMSYGLKPLCIEWLGYDTATQDKVKAYLDGTKSKDWSTVPTDILGEYACDDVNMNRQLYRMLQKERPAEQAQLWETEIMLTPVLFDMERYGMCIDVDECRKQLYHSLRIMIETCEELSNIIGREFTNSSQCFYEVLIQKYGLPVLATIKERDEEGRKYDTGRATFDADALVLYQNHPGVVYNPEVKHVLDLAMKYREEAQFKSLYLDSFLELQVDGIVHPQYNQCVKTGRMSCSRPNGQQQNKRSKKLLHPHPGMGFASEDLSQIEYRFIAHYIKDKRLIDAYNNDPTTDFHTWVAGMAHIERSPAKTLNFGMAFGSGKKLVTSNLTVDESIVREIGEIVDALIEDGQLPKELREHKFIELCQKHAESVYDTYHSEIPGIRTTSKTASVNCKIRGYVFNWAGRRRHLPSKVAYRAFNSVIQSSAADYMKERMIAMSPRYNKELREWGSRFSANVHDELLQEFPIEVLNDPKLHRILIDTMQTPSVEFRIPILTGLGISYDNWAEACGDMCTYIINGKKHVFKHKDLENQLQSFENTEFYSGKIC